jgi:preprotein translocase subunit YajC
MNFFIHDAYAAGGPPQGGDQFITIIIFVVLIAFFWLFLIRPQQKRQKELQKMIAAISKGDEVVTIGGVLGRVKDLDEQFITLEVATGVDHRIQRQAVSAVMPKGTLKNHLK